MSDRAEELKLAAKNIKNGLAEMPFPILNKCALVVYTLTTWDLKDCDIALHVTPSLVYGEKLDFSDCKLIFCMCELQWDDIYKIGPNESNVEWIKRIRLYIDTARKIQKEAPVELEQYY